VATTPFSVIDAALHSSLTTWAPLIALVPPDRIMRPDRSVDIRAIEASIDLRPKIWILPDASTIDGAAGSQDLVDLHFSYTIAITQKDADPGRMRELEYEVHRALLLLMSGHQGSGAPLVSPPVFSFVPPWFTIDRVSTLHFEPGQPESWKALFTITVRAQAARWAIIPPSPVFAELFAGPQLAYVTFDRPLVVGALFGSAWRVVVDNFLWAGVNAFVISGDELRVKIELASVRPQTEANSIGYTHFFDEITGAEFGLAVGTFSGFPIDNAV